MPSEAARAGAGAGAHSQLQLQGLQGGCDQGMCTSTARLARIFLNIPQYSLIPECEKAESAAGLSWELALLPQVGLSRGCALLVHALPAPLCRACSHRPSPRSSNNPIKKLVVIISVTQKLLSSPHMCSWPCWGGTELSWPRGLLEKGFPR